VLNRADSQDWLLEQFTTRLASVVEMMAGERPAIECQTQADPPAGGLTWHQPFAGAPGAVRLSAAEADFTAIGSHILLSAGLGDTDAESVKSTYFETLSQALSGLAQALSGKLKREVTPKPGQVMESEEAVTASPSFHWSRAEVKLPRQAAVVYVGFENTLLDSLTSVDGRELVNQLGRGANSPAFPAAAALAPITSKTFDLLLDVELPVSVSFGRAQVQLKDVLKLTMGSIVELNRSITEPVEVIVNNCVIARGEVVVIEGNFGVRIQHVISRQERLQTLK